MRYLLSLIMLGAFLFFSCESTPGPEVPEPLVPQNPDTLLWSTRIAHSIIHTGTSSPTLLSSGKLAVIYSGDERARLYHIDPNSGALLDSFLISIPVGRNFGLSFVSNQLIEDEFLTTTLGGVPLKVDLNDGTVIWHSNARSGSFQITDRSLFSNPVSGTGDPSVLFEINNQTGEYRRVQESTGEYRRVQESTGEF